MITGILLFAHGARDPRWAEPFEAVLAQLKASHPQNPAALSFLEFMSPNLLEGGSLLLEQGCTQVSVVPLFLGAGGHVRKDLPLLMAELREKHPPVSWQLTPAIGEVPRVVQAMAEAAAELAQFKERPQTCRFAPGPPRGMKKLGSGPAFSHEGTQHETD
jgi:sirohydrochlorin cobaltochelatase